MIGPEQFLALVFFALVMSGTPGPNNTMLLASGVNFGVRRTVPHMAGICIGVVVMLMLVGLGFTRLFASFPWLYTAMKWLGVAYMLWLAWKLANAGAMEGGGGGARPMTFLQAAAFQWVNPKAWAMAVTAMATYTTAEDFLLSVAVVAVVFGVVCLPTVFVWVLFGVGVRRVLSDPRAVKVFNWTMAGLLVASLWPVLAELAG